MAYDLSNVKDDFGLMGKGDYEVVVEKIEVKEYSTGTQYLNFWMRVRTDVEQAFQNKMVFDKVNQVKETGKFQIQRLSRIYKAANPDEENLKFDNLDTLLDGIIGKKLIAHVDVKYNDYFDEDENVVVFYKPTKHGDKTLDGIGTSNPPASGVGSDNVIVDEDDLPF